MRPIVDLVAPLLGRPYKLRAEGPDEFDCWSLTRYIQREGFGRELPEILAAKPSVATYVRIISQHPERLNWVVVEKPVHGAIVEMSHNNHPHHIGTWLDVDGGGVLHCIEGPGVCFDPLIAMRAAGWRRFVYNDWIG